MSDVMEKARLLAITVQRSTGLDVSSQVAGRSVMPTNRPPLTWNEAKWDIDLDPSGVPFLAPELAERVRRMMSCVGEQAFKKAFHEKMEGLAWIDGNLAQAYLEAVEELELKGRSR